MDHTRHINIFHVPQHFSVGLVGAGGIGAMTALMLAKMGVVQLTVWDDDTISATNIPTQLHPVSDVGKPKVESLKETLERFSDEILFFGDITRLTQHTVLFDSYNLFISAVDSITARQHIWTVVTHTSVDWYLDLRMSAEQFQYYLVDMHDLGAVERYHALLMSVSEEDIPEVPCTMKATFYTSAMSAGHAGTVLRNIVRNEATSQRLVHYIPQNTIYVFNI